MPKVATVAIPNATNAGLMAVRILGIAVPDLQRRFVLSFQHKKVLVISTSPRARTEEFEEQLRAKLHCGLFLTVVDFYEDLYQEECVPQLRIQTRVSWPHLFQEKESSDLELERRLYLFVHPGRQISAAAHLVTLERL